MLGTSLVGVKCSIPELGGSGSVGVFEVRDSDADGRSSLASWY